VILSLGFGVRELNYLGDLLGILGSLLSDLHFLVDVR